MASHFGVRMYLRLARCDRPAAVALAHTVVGKYPKDVVRRGRNDGAALAQCQD